jgi:hypothetical protein
MHFPYRYSPFPLFQEVGGNSIKVSTSFRERISIEKSLATDFISRHLFLFELAKAIFINTLFRNEHLIYSIKIC